MHKSMGQQHQQQKQQQQQQQTKGLTQCAQCDAEKQ
jgi:hypothetical protein